MPGPTIPSIGNVITPAGFTCFSIQGGIQLTWQTTPLATTYYISSSTDNTTFTSLAQTSSTSYVDTTQAAGVVTYYILQAGNGTNSSVQTQSVSGVSLLPGQMTVGNIRLEILQRINKEKSQFYTVQEQISMVSQSYKELWNILEQKFGDDYFVATPYTYTTGNNQQLYPLPTDFKALLGVEVALNPADPNSWITLRAFEFIQRNLYNYPNVYTFYGITNLRYRLNGSNLYIVPVTQAGQTIRIWYVPRPNQLIYDTDIVDGVAGWEEYIVADCCIKALAKEESDVSVFAAQKLALIKRVEEEAENRNIGEPQMVSDSKVRNFSWSEPGDSGGKW